MLLVIVPIIRFIIKLRFPATEPNIQLNIFFVPGRAIFTTTHFEKGQFLLLYGGELISKDEAVKKEELGEDHQQSYRYHFQFKEKGLW